MTTLRATTEGGEAKTHANTPLTPRVSVSLPKFRRHLSTSARGYGFSHQRLKDAWRLRVATGTVPCARVDCLEVRDGRSRLIAVGAPWDLGHVDGDRSRYSGPEHQRCNRATAGRRRGRVSRSW